MSRQITRRACVLAILAAAVFVTACGSVTFVERIIIVNATDYPARVEVRDQSGGWLGLTTVSAHEIREVTEVIDRGTSWTFRFSYGSHAPVERTMSRDDLTDAAWRVEVPDELEENLQMEDVSPPP